MDSAQSRVESLLRQLVDDDVELGLRGGQPLLALTAADTPPAPAH